jgi:hypothetical protein
MSKLTLLPAIAALLVFAWAEPIRCEIVTDAKSSSDKDTAPRTVTFVESKPKIYAVTDADSPRQIQKEKDQLLLDVPELEPQELDAPPEGDLDTESDLAAPLGDAVTPAGLIAPGFSEGGGPPNMVGDFFGTGSTLTTIAQTFSFQNVVGNILSGGPSDPNATLGFDVGGSSAHDLFTVDTASGMFTFNLAEPVPPTGAPIPSDPSFQFAGGTATRSGSFVDGDQWDLSYDYTKTIIVPGPAGLVVGRQKLSEDVSPIPRNRIFFNYSMFDNTPIADGGVTVNRFTPGFETTMFDEMMSFELRAPMAVTLSSVFIADAQPEVSQYEFGDVFMAFKVLMLCYHNVAVSAGFSMTVPTADDTNVLLSDGTPLVAIDNRSVHVMPFVGGLYARDRFFAQGFAQIDVDANGDRVSVNQNILGTPSLTEVGTLHEATFLYLDLAVGYWLRRDYGCSGRRITGIAPVAEFHLNRSLQQTDSVQSGNFQIGQREDVQVLNALAGCAIEFYNSSTVTVAYGAPVGSGDDQQFDGELRVLFNRFF